MYLRIAPVLAFAVVMAWNVAAQDNDDRIQSLEKQVEELKKLVREQANSHNKELGQLKKENEAFRAKQQDISVNNAVDGVYYRAMGAATATAAYLDYDRPDIKGVGLFFTGEYLYTKVQKGETTFAYRNDVNTADPIGIGPGTGIMPGSAQNTELDWGHGFRLGLGYRLPYDGWEVAINYAHLETDSDRAARADTTGGTNFLISPYYQAQAALAEAEQDFDFNKLNIELSRRSKISKALSVRFFAGPSVVWLDDEDKFSYWGDANLALTFFPNFDGTSLGGVYRRDTDTALYGIRAGADGDFKLGKGIAVYGSLAGSLLTGEQEHTTFRATDLNSNGAFSTDEIFANVTTKFHLVVPVIETEAGVSWDYKINDGFNLKLSAGYQLSQYFNVLETTTTQALGGIVPINNITRTKSDLGMHGLVFRVRLDF